MFSSLRTYFISAGIRPRLRRYGLLAEPEGIRCDPKVVEDKGVRLRIGPHLHPEINRCILEGRYNRTERALIESRLRSDDVVLEFGTCIGHMAIVCARRIGDDRMFSFEANEAMRPIVEDHFRLNDVWPTVRYEAIAGREGDAILRVVADQRDSSLYGEEGTPCGVRTAAVADVITEIRPTVLIVDIEGGEADVLQAAELGEVRLLLIEMHPETIGAGKVNRLRSGVRQHGFRETSPDGRNFLFWRAG